MSSEKTDLIEKKEGKNFSKYGTYVIEDKLELKLPKTEIVIEKKSDNQFSYYRKNSEGQITNKLIPIKEKELKIELAPILPLNLPAKKTNDLMFLRLAQSIYVEKNSKIKILVQFPIEIGVYIINQQENSQDFFDCFTCEPMHSRFALYGTPEVGHLCMYSKVGIVEKNQHEPYFYALMKISISNKLEMGQTIGKFVFPVTNHDIYYRDEDNVAHIDDIKAKIKKDYANDVMTIEHVPFSEKDKDWKLSPKMVSQTMQSFVMDKGFD